MENGKVLKNVQEGTSKWAILVNLKEGSKVLLTSGEEATFIRFKKKNFVAIIKDKSYNVPIEMFKKVLQEATLNEGYKTLKIGEPFYISTGKDAILFTFSGIKNGRIVGTCPITKTLTNIDASMYAGKVSELK